MNRNGRRPDIIPSYLQRVCEASTSYSGHLAGLTRHGYGYSCGGGYGGGYGYG
jgi:hypothetical protein